MRTGLLLATALAGCGPLVSIDLWGGSPDPTPITGVSAEVSEYPVAGGTNNGKTPWSCTAKDLLTAEEAQAIAWSVGAPLVVQVREHHQSGGINCAPSGWTLESMDPAIWKVAPGPHPDSSFEGCSSYAQALAPGDGRLLAKVDEFTTELHLRVVAPTGVGFYQLTSSEKEGGKLTLVTELHDPGEYEIVPVPMGPGGRLCGYVPMEASASGVRLETGRGILATGEDSPRGNGPITVFLDKGAPGGTLTVTLAGATGVLPVAPR